MFPIIARSSTRRWRYLIRLEKEDLAGEMLKKLAAAVKMPPEDVKKRLAVTVE